MKKLYFISGIIILTLLIWNIVLWITISADYSKTLNEVKKEYLEHFPVFLRKGYTKTLISIVLAGVSAFLFWKVSRFENSKGFRKIVLLLFYLSLLICGWMLFTLM